MRSRDFSYIVAVDPDIQTKESVRDSIEYSYPGESRYVNALDSRNPMLIQDYFSGPTVMLEIQLIGSDRIFHPEPGVFCILTRRCIDLNF
jgi:hypothetical protein